MAVTAPQGSGYPVSVTFAPTGDLTRWKPFVQWLLVVPHLVVLGVLGIGSAVVSFVSWFTILFTGSLPANLAGYQQLYLRYANRTMAYASFLHEGYPPFGFDLSGADSGDDPGVRTDVASALDGRNRVTVAFRALLAIPHTFVLAILEWVLLGVLLVAAFVVAATGAWPASLRDLAEGVIRWNTRVGGYVLLLTDEYPPFSLE
jgi:Domain of unknown function (DUF4389)